MFDQTALRYRVKFSLRIFLVVAVLASLELTAAFMRSYAYTCRKSP